MVSVSGLAVAGVLAGLAILGILLDWFKHDDDDWGGHA